MPALGQPRLSRRLPLLAFVATVSVVFGACLSTEHQPFPLQLELSGRIFGTTWSAKIIGASDQYGPELLEAMHGRLQQLDSALSTYRDDSELVRLNRSPDAVTEISQELYELLALSQDVHSSSGGAFDVTLGPLIELWGFGRRKDLDRVPPPAAIEALLEQTGGDLYSLDVGPPTTVTRTRKELEIDLSAIAKGYAVDELHHLLLELGFADHLVEIGGEIRVHGAKPGNELWTLAVEGPQVSSRTIARLLRLAPETAESALATSGDYRNFYEVDGQRYSHTLDPTTGRPVAHNGASVSVLAPTCAEADAWATALLVLGPEQGRQVAEQEDIAAYFLTYDAGQPAGYRESVTSRWAEIERAGPSTPETPSSAPGGQP